MHISHLLPRAETDGVGRYRRRAAHWPILGFVALLGACGGGESDELPAASPQPSDPLFAEDQLHTYELVIAEADWQRLNETALEKEYVPGVLRFAGSEYGPIGVRYKGGFGTLRTCFDLFGNRTCDKLSMKLKFDEYDPDLRFFGLKKLNFHSMTSDRSQMRDRLAYGLFRAMGVPAPRAVHGQLVVNGTSLGLFAVVEAIDGRFTRRWFPDGGEGNLYKEVWPVHLEEAPYLAALETNEDEMPTARRMVRFAGALADAADDRAAEAVLAGWTDLELLAGFLAVDRAIDNWDGFVGWYCRDGTCNNHNYYWYEQTDADRVWLIPWDMDHTFEVPNPITTYFGIPAWDEPVSSCAPQTLFLGIGGRAPGCDSLTRRLATVLDERLRTRTRELLDGPFAGLEAQMTMIQSQIAAAVAADASGPGTAEWQKAVAALRDDVAALRASAQR
jgi:hypothetical protein